MNSKNRNPVIISEETYYKTSDAIEAFDKNPSKVLGNAARSRLTKLLTAYMNDWWFDGYNLFRDVFYDIETGKLTVRMKIRNAKTHNQKNISYDIHNMQDVEVWLDKCYKKVHSGEI
jgi:hypothetical protein